MTETIQLQGRDISYVLKRSKRRTIGFSINHAGLTVSAPNRLSHRSVEDGLKEKSGWILDKLSNWENRTPPREPVFESGEAYPWLGSELRLQLVEQGIRTHVKRDQDALVVSHDPKLEGALKARTIRSALERYYKREGLILMKPKVEAYAAQLNRRVSKVIVRGQKRRWGSCASDASIRLNWRLMGFPEALIDYVCAHEAAHLVEANHAPAFWAEVEALMPDWKERRDLMRSDCERWVLL